MYRRWSLPHQASLSRLVQTTQNRIVWRKSNVDYLTSAFADLNIGPKQHYKFVVLVDQEHST